jgi:hypothetical protein
MSNQITKPTAGVLMIALIAAMSACLSEEPAPPPAAPAMLLQVSPQPSTFVGTVPVPRADERAITPVETAGAAAN